MPSATVCAERVTEGGASNSGELLCFLVYFSTLLLLLLLVAKEVLKELLKDRLKFDLMLLFPPLVATVGCLA